MDTMIILVLVCVSAFWVYWDATGHKIGKLPDEKGTFNISAGSWAMVTLLLWIVGFPAYLINRSRLIEKAKESPVDSKLRYGGATVLAVLALCASFGAYSMYSTGTLPNCNSPEVVQLTNQIVSESPAVQILGLTDISISSHGEKHYNSSSETRFCRGVLKTPLGDEVISYSVEWHNKNTGEFWVQILN